MCQICTLTTPLSLPTHPLASWSPALGVEPGSHHWGIVLAQSGRDGTGQRWELEFPGTWGKLAILAPLRGGESGMCQPTLCQVGQHIKDSVSRFWGAPRSLHVTVKALYVGIFKLLHFSPKVMCKRQSNHHSSNVPVSRILVSWNFDLSPLSPLAIEEEEVPRPR